jgi:O-antigen/teichoic acid export membrane protein
VSLSRGHVQFAKDVAIVASGTAGAQFITLAFAPLITRIYAPEAFGILGAFLVVVGIVTPFAAGSYPTAIVLPKDDSDALGIAKLSLMIAGVTAALTAFLVLSLEGPIVAALNIQAMSELLWLIPCGIFAAACLSVSTQWVIRKSLFKVKASAAVAQALIVNGARVGIGWFSPTAAVLLFLAVAGNLLHAITLAVGAQRKMQGSGSSPAEAKSLLALAKKHRDFPLYRAPQDAISAASHGLPVLLLAGFFGPVAAGYYSLGRMVLSIPLMLVAQSVGEVIYPRISEASHRGEDLSRLIIMPTLVLAAIGLGPFALLAAFGPWLFGFAFGAEWVTAGEYARWLSIMLFFNFINRPSIAAVPVLGLQRGLMIYEMFSAGFKLLALYLGFTVSGQDMVGVALFALTGAAAYVLLISWIIFVARNRGLNQHAGKTSRESAL